MNQITLSADTGCEMSEAEFRAWVSYVADRDLDRVIGAIALGIPLDADNQRTALRYLRAAADRQECGRCGGLTPRVLPPVLGCGG